MVSVPGEESYDVLYRATADFDDFFAKVDQANEKLKELKKNANAVSTDSKIRVSVDATQAKVDLSDINKRVDDTGKKSATVKVKADTTEATSKVDIFKKRIEEISGEKATTLTVDDFTALAKVEEFKAKLEDIKNRAYKADVEIDMVKLTAEVAEARALLDSLGKNTSPGVAKWADIQKRNLQSLLAEGYVLDQKLQDSKTKVMSFFEGFTSGTAKAKDAMAATDNAVQKLWISLKNLASAQKDLFKSLGNSDQSTSGAAGNVLASLDAVGNGLISVFTMLGKALIGPIGAIGSLLPLLPMLAAGVASVGAPVIGLASSLGSLVGVMGVMPSFMTAMISGMAVLKLAITPVTTAITALGQATTAAQVTTALQNLSPAAANAALALYNFKKAISSDSSNSVQNSFWGALAPALSKLPNLVKPINALLGGTAKAMGQILNTTILWFEAFTKTSGFKQLVQENTYLIQDLGSAFQSVLKIITSVAIAAMPLTNALASGIANAAAKLADIVQKASVTQPGHANSPLRQAFVDLEPRLKVVWDILKNIFLTVVDLGKAALPFGDNLFKSIDKITQKWHEWAAAQDKPQSAFKQWLTDVRPILTVVSKLISGIVKGFVAVATNPQNISDFSKTLSALGPAIGSILQGLLSIGTSLGPGTITVIQDLAKILNLIGDALNWIGRNKVGADVLGITFKVLAGFGAAAVLLKTVGAVTNMFKVAAGVGASTLAFLKSLKDIASGDGSIWDKIKAIFSGGGKEATVTPLQAAADTMIDAAKMMQEAADTMVKAALGGDTAAGGAAAGAAGGEAVAASSGIVGAIVKLLGMAAIAAAIAAVVWTVLPSSVKSDIVGIVKNPVNNTWQNRVDVAVGGVPGNPWQPKGLTNAPGLPGLGQPSAKSPVITQHAAPLSIMQTLFGGPSYLPFEPALKSVWSTFKRDVGDKISSWFMSQNKEIGKSFASAWNTVYSGFMRDVGTPTANFVTKSIPNFFTSTVPKWWNTGYNWFTKEVGTPVSNFITKSIPNFFTSTVPRWFQNVRSWFDRDVGSYVSNFITKSIPNFFTSTVPRWFDNVRSWFDRDVGSYISNFVTKSIPNFFTSTIPKWFSSVASWFERDVGTPLSNFFTKTVPNAIGSGFKSGINWVIDNVINRAIGFINDIIGIIPGVPKIGTVRNLASGGNVSSVVPGRGGADTVPAMLMPGEFVIRKAAAQKIGINRLNQLNQADRTHQFASGGTVPGGGNGLLFNSGQAELPPGIKYDPAHMSSLWGGIGNIIGAAASGAFDAFGEVFHWVRGELASTLNAGWDSLIQPIVNQVASSMGWAGKIGAAGTNDIEKGIAALIAGNDNAYNQATANLGGSIPSGQHLQIINDALKAAGINQNQWIKWETGLNTLVNRESGWDPRSINLTDINAKNGDPSKGLAQVIGATFARYHVAGTSNDIYDPVANIAAAIRYILATYGDITNVQQANANMAPKGYASGGLVLPNFGRGLASGGHIPTLAAPSYASMAGSLQHTYNHGGTTVNIGNINNPRPEPASMSTQRVLDTKRTFAGRF